MTNKLEISRELAERAVKAIEKHHSSMAWGIAKELRALLAAPVVEAAKCGVCGQGAWACNEGGCHYLESGNGAPVVERQPVYQAEYLGDGGGGWADFEYREFKAYQNKSDFRTRILYTSPTSTVVMSRECKTCGGSRVVDDGELHCSSGGIPFENGPIKCVKDCPDCLYAEQPAPVAVALLSEAREWLGDGKYSDGLSRELWTPAYAALIDKIDGHLDKVKELTPTTAIASNNLRNFANAMIDIALEGADADGAQIQELAVENGLLKPEQRTERCGDTCSCAEYADFPVECFRKVKELNQ